MVTTAQARHGAERVADALKAAAVTLPRAAAIDLNRIRAILDGGNLSLEIYDGAMPTRGRWKPRHWNARLVSVPMVAIREGAGYRLKRDGGDDWHMVERTGVAQWCRVVGAGGEPLFGMACFIAGQREPGQEWGLELERLRLDAREHLNYWLVLEVNNDAELVELFTKYGTATAAADLAPRSIETPPEPVGLFAMWRSLPVHARGLVFMCGMLIGVVAIIMAQGLAGALANAGY